MILILEGCDKTGKSTIARELSKIFGCRVIKRPKYLLPQAGVSYESMYRQYQLVLHLFKDEKLVILDRFSPSEIVYSIKRGEDKLYNDKTFASSDYKDIWGIENEINALPHLLVVVDEDEKTLKKRFEEDGEDYLKADEIKMIRKRYLDFFEKTRIKNKVLLPKGSSVEERVMFLIRKITLG